MQIRQQVSLQPFNTMNCAVSCDYFAELESVEEILQAQQFAESQQLPILILGGGSNIVLTRDFHGLVVKIALRGMHIEAQPLTDGRVKVIAAAGENWDDLVSFCLHKQLCGLENLSLIPGSVGAAPIQNIGAYGVELSESIIAVNVWDLAQKCSYSISAKDCRFGYRDSVFKHALCDRVVITSIELGLYPAADAPPSKIHYQPLQDFFSGREERPTAEEVRAAVIAIRQSKLPDPKLLPNVGSFFKNPVVSSTEFERLKRDHPELPSYPPNDGTHKLPAAWLIDHRGWKGKSQAQVAVHDAQALVLVNRARAQSGEAVMALAETIRKDIYSSYNILLEIEPRIY